MVLFLYADPKVRDISWFHCNNHIIPLWSKGYCELVDITGTVIRHDTTMQGRAYWASTTTFTVKGLSDEQWLTLTTEFEKQFCYAQVQSKWSANLNTTQVINAFGAKAKGNLATLGITSENSKYCLPKRARNSDSPYYSCWSSQTNTMPHVYLNNSTMLWQAYFYFLKYYYEWLGKLIFWSIAR